MGIMRKGVLLMAHGVARDIDDIPRYYAHIRHGQPLSAAVQQELVDRYRAIGGHSPLGEITASLAGRVQAALEQQVPGTFGVFYGFRHAAPFIADAVRDMAVAGVSEAVGIALAPHYSAFSTDLYIKAAEAGLEEAGRPFSLTYVRTWHLDPDLIALLAERVKAARDRLPPAVKARAPVIFTAHSLPERIRASGDPYPEELVETARAVSETLSLPRWGTAWQSAGRTAEPWLGPDILEKLDELAKAAAGGVVVCPCGFTADHLEVLYDLDIQARERARELGLAFERTASLNDDPRFAAALANLARRALERG
jgi:ferrochelatase